MVEPARRQRVEESGDEGAERLRHVTVALATYRRPEDLQRCLAALVPEVERASSQGRSVDVLVVDNDATGSARTTVEPFRARGVRYVVEARAGIAAARNRALDEIPDSDTVVFIDDDETPNPGWLEALLETQRRLDAQVVAGWVVSDLAGLDDPWIAAGGFFSRPNPPTGSVITAAATNNLLVDLALLRAAGLRFDDRYGLSGGSDTDLTRRLHRHGARMVWCAEAVVVDHVPASRLTRSWVLAKHRRIGNVRVIIAVDLAPSPARRGLERARGCVGGLVRVGVGSALRVGGVVGPLAWSAHGARLMAVGRGMLGAALGRRVVEYGRP